MENNMNNFGQEQQGYQAQPQPTPQPTYSQPYYYQQPMQPVQPAQQPRKKNSRFGLAAAIIAIAIVVGGSAGFGGAMIGTNLIGASSPAQSAQAPQQTAGTSGENSSAATAEGDEPTNGDVSTALNAIAQSENSGSGQKIHPYDVQPTGANGAYTSEELYQAVNDTIVLVKVYKKRSSSYDYYNYYFGFGGDSRDRDDGEPVYSGYGSGIVFTEDGYILTNAHVVENADKVVVVVNDYNDKDKTYEYEVKVVGSDTSSDIAVLKADRSEKFVAAKLGDSDSLKVGQTVAAIGNPGVTAEVMFAHSMTQGIISGLDVECLSDSGYSLSLIQTDAAINSGNSGGGLFDMYGNVVGVVNSKIVASTYEGLGFALTINEAKPVMEDLLNYGYVKSRPVLGVHIVELTEAKAQLYDTKLSQGLLLVSMNEGAPIEKSGVKISDIITKVNGTNVSSLMDVQKIIGKFKAGDKVTVTVARENSSGGMDSLDFEVELTNSTKSNSSR